jgi:Major Facilitator Superfamily
MTNNKGFNRRHSRVRHGSWIGSMRGNPAFLSSRPKYAPIPEFGMIVLESRHAPDWSGPKWFDEDFNKFLFVASGRVLLHTPENMLEATANTLAFPADVFPKNTVGSVWGLASMGSGFGGMLFMGLSGWLIGRYGYTPVFIGYGIAPLIALVCILFLIGPLRLNPEFQDATLPLTSVES